MCIGSGCDSSSSRLEDQGRYITAAEQNCVSPRVEAREILSIDDDVRPITAGRWKLSHEKRYEIADGLLSYPVCKIHLKESRKLLADEMKLGHHAPQHLDISCYPSRACRCAMMATASGSRRGSRISHRLVEPRIDLSPVSIRGKLLSRPYQPLLWEEERE